MKVALIGVGGMGGNHINIYKSMEDVELVAVIDKNAEKASEKIKGTRSRIYDSIKDMLQHEKPDMLDICSPTYLHAEHAIEAMDNGLHVLCEKPIALTPETAKDMVAASKRNSVYFMVAQVIRFWPEYRYLKNIFDKKSYGELIQIRFSRTGSRPRWSWNDWMLDAEKSGRVPIDLHVHDVDFILYLLGSPKSVVSHGKEEGEKLSYISTHYEYDNILVEAEGAWYDQKIPFSMEFRACFEDAVLEYSNNQLKLFKEGKEGVIIEREHIVAEENDTNITSKNGYREEIRYFIDCVRNKKPLEITTPESTVNCLEIIYKELESIKTGSKVYIKI